MVLQDFVHKFSLSRLSKILQNHFLGAFVADLKIYALNPESFCDKNLAIRKVFAFCDSASLLVFVWYFNSIVTKRQIHGR